MRDLRELNKYRVRNLEPARGITPADWEVAGVFRVHRPKCAYYHNIIATSGEGWDHISVSYKLREPNWAEMDYIKRLFFKDNETAMQLHVAVTDHINHHPNCLHLWRPWDGNIPLPPKEFV